MKKLLSVLMLALAALVPMSGLAQTNPSSSVPLRWSVETSRATPAAFEEYAGGAYDFEATLNSYGEPLPIAGDAYLFWQTNGMASAFWQTPATVSNNVLKATWLPEMDVGAKSYNCFIGVPGTVYNAAFQLRLRPSPGATPNELPLPVKTLDFAKVVVTNAPYYTQSEIDSALDSKANLMGGNIFYNDQWIANGDLNLVAAGFYVDRSGTGQEYIDGRWNGDYWAFMGTKRFLVLNGLDFSSAMGASAPTIDGNAIATTANLASKVSTNSTITIKRADTPYGATQSLLDYYGLVVEKSGTGGGTIRLGMTSNTSPYPQLSLYGNAGMYISSSAELIFQGNRSWQDFGLTNAAAAKQDILVAGENITISNNVISATGGSVEPSPGWYREGDWRPVADVNTTRIANTFTHSTTNDIGSVYSNVTITVGYDLSARLRTDMLDNYSINPPPQVTWTIDATSASIATNTIVATASDVYHVLATATNGVQKSVNVPLSIRPTSETSTTYYAADISTNRWIKATNDEFLQLLSTITTDGVAHQYPYGEYLNWNFPTNRVFFRHGNTSYGSYLISPHVVASAAHYSNAYSKTFTATFYTASGTAHNLTFSTTGKNVAKRWNLADWARAQHKWTDEEINAMRISDITVYIADSGSAAAESCPYFISEENWRKYYSTDRRSIMGWATTQLNSDKRKCAYPMAIDCTINGTVNFAGPAIMDSSTYWQDYGSGQPMMRADIREYFRNLGSNADYWKFPTIYSGDSGSPVFIFHDQRPILLSHFWTTSGGPNYIKGLPVLREFCDKQVKTALGLSQGDILKEVE